MKCENAKRIGKLKVFEDIKEIKWNRVWEVESKIQKKLMIKSFLIWKSRCDIVLSEIVRSDSALEKMAEELIRKQEVLGFL